MTDGDALAAVLPCAREMWGLVRSHEVASRDHPSDPAAAFDVFATALAAMYELGYEVGRASCSTGTCTGAPDAEG